MARFNMYEAKTRLSELVEKVKAGDEVILMNRGQPVARIIPFENSKKVRKLGIFEKEIRLRAGWDAPIDDFKDYLK